MNPAFVIIVFLACIIIQFMASGIYKSIGKFVYRIGKDSIDAMNEDDSVEDNKKNVNESEDKKL